MTQLISIVMTGQLPTPPYEAVFWTVFGEPDMTGAQSGYGAGFLLNIGVDSVSETGSAVNPITLQVGGDLFGNLPNPTVVGLQGQHINPVVPASGDVLTFNPSLGWTPVTSPAPGIVGGDLSGTLPNPTVVGLQTKPISATAPTSGQYLVWSGTAWTPTTFPSAGGDLSGTYPNPTVVGLQTKPVDATAPTTGQFLVFNGTRWAPSTFSATAGGDLSGTYPNPTVVGLQGKNVVSTAPTINQVLTFDGTRWGPATLPAVTWPQMVTAASTAAVPMAINGQSFTKVASVDNQTGAALTLGTASNELIIDNTGTGKVTFKSSGSPVGQISYTSTYWTIQSLSGAASGMQILSPGFIVINPTSILTMGGNAGTWLQPLTGVVDFYASNRHAAAFAFDPNAGSGISLVVRAGTGANPGNAFTLAGQQGQAVAAGTNNIGGDIVLVPGIVGTGGSGGRGGNIGLLGAPSGGGASDGVVYILNCTTAPTTIAPSGGGMLFVSAGALKYIGTSGTVTTIAAA